MSSFDAVVVGGGIVGSSVAYHLAREGWETVLFDRRDEGRATDAGAGILAPATSSRTGDDAWFRFAVEAVDYYPALADRLRAEQDGDTSYAECGLLSVAYDDEEVAAFEAAGERLAERSARLGVPAPDRFGEVTGGAARERCPALGEPRRARFFEDAARVDGAAFAAATRRAAEGHGLTVERGDVTRVVVEDGAVAGVVADGERVAADGVVVAGGAWSPALADDLGVSVPVAPERGQIAHLRPGGSATGDWPIVKAFRGHYLVPWPGGRVVAGATREADAHAPRRTAGGVREVLGEALRVAPGLADAELAEVRVGLRPTAADRRPLLGPVPGVDGAFLATGHGATGLQLGPFSGRVVAALVRGEEPGVDLSPFRVDRFA